jgi:excisionase family DNA binding protein
MLIHEKEQKNNSTTTDSSNIPSIDQDTLWTVDEVALFLKLNPETVRKMARHGELQAIKIRRVWRVKKSSVIKLIN